MAQQRVQESARRQSPHDVQLREALDTHGKNLDETVDLAQPLEQQAAEPITRIDLELPNAAECARQGAFAFVLKGVLSRQECENWIDSSERRGYSVALINAGRDRQILDTDTRNSARNIFDCSDTARMIFQRLRTHIPATLLGRRCTGLNERLRFLRYGPGQYFAPHLDGCYARPDGSEASLLTLMLYLNDGGGAQFVGGETNFLDWRDEDRKATVVPAAGDVLVFTHAILHEGAAVTAGVKYAVRTDVMYARA